MRTHHHRSESLAMNPLRRIGRRIGLAAAGALLLAALTSIPLGPSVAAAGQQPAGEKKAEPAASGKDVVLMRNGQRYVGKILSETDTTVKMRFELSGITGETELAKNEILKIERASAADASASTDKTATGPANPPEPAKPAKPSTDDEGKQKVYYMELTGKFGKDISQTPLRDAMDDAKKLGASTVIVYLENDWSLFQGMQEKGDDTAAFDELFRAEDMEGVFSDDLRQWPTPPRIVFWVKKAMGGAAFLPLVCPDIYFHSEGRMGGIGNLTHLFGSTGDEVVRQKQYSLRLGHAEGMANKGGYDPVLVRAMAIPEIVLSVRFEGGKPIYFEGRLPQGPDEYLLTDDGKDSNKDTDAQLVKGEGNDVLTLNAKLAKDLLVSKGTVDTRDDLMFELGLQRSGVIVEGRGKQIMKAWRDGVDAAIRDIPKLRGQAAEIQVSGSFQERSKARGQKKRLLMQVQSLLKKYKEVFGGQADQMISSLNIDIEGLDQDQQRDYNEERRRK